MEGQTRKITQILENDTGFEWEVECDKAYDY